MDAEDRSSVGAVSRTRLRRPIPLPSSLLRHLRMSAPRDGGRSFPPTGGPRSHRAYTQPVSHLMPPQRPPLYPSVHDTTPVPPPGVVRPRMHSSPVEPLDRPPLSTGSSLERSVQFDGSRAGVLTLGYGSTGQLGHGDFASLGAPREVSLLQRSDISTVRCGLFHTAAVSLSTGRVFTWGRGHHGCLGHGDKAHSCIPKPVAALEGKRIISVSCGGYHTVALEENGRVWTWGSGDHGILGHGWQSWFTRDRKVPARVEGLRHIVIRKIATGSGHNAVISEGGTLFVWGHGKYGRLGLGDSRSYWTPTPVKQLDRVVRDVAFGSFVMSCGRDQHGQCGSGSWGTTRYVFCIIDALRDKDVHMIACGWNHCTALTEGGDVYTWGDGGNGRLGHPYGFFRRASKNTPTVVKALQGKGIVGVTCGAEHSLALSVTGVVYVFGNGRQGQLGLNKPRDVWTPVVSDRLGGNRVKVVHLDAGGWHTAAVVASMDVGTRETFQRAVEIIPDPVLSDAEPSAPPLPYEETDMDAERTMGLYPDLYTASTTQQEAETHEHVSTNIAHTPPLVSTMPEFFSGLLVAVSDTLEALGKEAARAISPKAQTTPQPVWVTATPSPVPRVTPPPPVPVTSAVVAPPFVSAVKVLPSVPAMLAPEEIAPPKEVTPAMVTPPSVSAVKVLPPAPAMLAPEEIAPPKEVTPAMVTPPSVSAVKVLPPAVTRSPPEEITPAVVELPPPEEITPAIASSPPEEITPAVTSPPPQNETEEDDLAPPPPYEATKAEEDRPPSYHFVAPPVPPSSVPVLQREESSIARVIEVEGAEQEVATPQKEDDDAETAVVEKKEEETVETDTLELKFPSVPVDVPEAHPLPRKKDERALAT